MHGSHQAVLMLQAEGEGLKQAWLLQEQAVGPASLAS